MSWVYNIRCHRHFYITTPLLSLTTRSHTTYPKQKRHFNFDHGAAMIPVRTALISQWHMATIFGMKYGISRGRRVVAMVILYKAMLVTPYLGNVTIECPEDFGGSWIGLALLVLGCARLTSEESSPAPSARGRQLLDDEQMEVGWVLTCVAYPRDHPIIWDSPGGGA
ncbi:hypothetical protein Cgig2_000971 [Carnegiea gigantea]|uniref:Ferredoxin n=1 Tax=Carnegiea gigantea TaxID=171969 RepID=A0A9Q1JM51_9CARY|nr:hypothetical protein Cgig2_000971 [Carnegiea gigantea]